MSTELSTTLPPGNRYFPLLGETLAFMREPFGFVAERVAKYGPIFRTHLFGSAAIVVASGKNAGVFANEELCARANSMPDNVRELLGGRSLNLLDGTEHHTRKERVLASFGPEVLPTYVPAMQQLVESTLASWVAKGEVNGVNELKQLAIVVLAKNVLSVDPGPDTEALIAHFRVLTAGFTGLPVPLPGTVYTKAIQARDAIFEILKKSVAIHRETKLEDGLARMLAHPVNGTLMNDDDAVMELHHIFVAGYIVFSELVAMLTELDAHPELRERLRAEILDTSPNGTIAPRALGGMHLLGRVVLETKRTTPVVPIVFGKARKSFQVGGFYVPEGITLCWTPYAHHQDGTVFPVPGTFDPERFNRNEHKTHEHAFAPQGLGPDLGHKCAGTDYATVLMQVFAVVLLRNYAWAFPDQDLSLRFDCIPPEPRDGLKVVFRESVPTTPSVIVLPKSSRRIIFTDMESPRSEHKLNREQLLALADIMWVDGKAEPAEIEALEKIGRVSGVADAEVKAAISTKRSAPATTPIALPALEAEHLYALACLMSSADGKVDAAERDAVAALAVRLTLSDEQRVRATVAAHAIASTLGVAMSPLIAMAREISEASNAGPLPGPK